MSTPVSRRSALKLLAGTAGMAVLAACGGQAAPSAAPPSAAAPTSSPPSTAAAPASAAPSVSAPVSAAPSSAAPAASAKPAASASGAPSAAAQASSQPKTGGTLRFAQPANPVSIDGNSIAGGGNETGWLVFDRLTSYDQNLKPQPMLAESWDIAPDFKTFKLNLRKGVTYHSGREFTSDDVKYTILRLRDSTVGSGILAGFSKWFTTIDTPDKNTVLLTSDSPHPTFFDAIELINIVDKQNVEGPDAKTKIVGTGAWVFSEWAPGDHFTVVKNKNYWQSGRPYMDSVITYVRSQQNMSVQLEGGQLDMVRTPTVEDFVRLKADKSYQAIIHPVAGTFFEIGLNTVKPPFDDKRVRQAFNWAIDRKRFSDTVMKGISESIDLPWDKSNPAFDTAKNATYTFNLDKARALLKDAGVTNLETGILVNGVGAPQTLQFAQIYQDSLSQVGVKLNIQNVEPAVWVDTLINKKPDYTGLWCGTDQIAQLQPSTLFQLSPGWRLDNNHSAFKSDQWTTLVNASLSESDPAKQKTLLAQLNDYILDQSFTIAYNTYPTTFLAKANVQGLTYQLHNGGLSFTDSWLA